MRGRRLIIKRARNHELVARDRKQAAGIVQQRIRRAVTRIRVDRRQSAHDRIGRAVFRNRRMGKPDGGRCLVDVGYADREGFVEGQPAGIGDAHGHLLRVRSFVIERSRNDEIRAGNRKASSGVVDQGIGRGIAAGSVGIDSR